MGMLRKIGILAFILIAGVLSLQSAFALEKTSLTVSYTLDAGLLLNNSQLDVFNGTFVGDAIFTSAGKIGGAVDLDGNGDSASSTLIMDSSNLNFSIEFWISHDTVNADFDWYMESRSTTDAAAQGVGIAFQGESNQYSAFCDASGSDLGTTVTSAASAPGAGFNHIIATYNNSDFKVYRNTTSIINITPCTPPNHDRAFDFGRHAEIASRSLDGQIDLIRVWNRTLNDSEVVGLFNLGEGKNHSDLDVFPDPTPDTINVSDPEPANNTQHNTLLLNINATVNTSLVFNEPFNVTLFVDGVANQTITGITAGTNVNISFNLSFSVTEERELGFFLSVFDNTTQENTTNHTIFIDNVNPIITTIQSPQNNTAFKSILDGQFNFTDSFLLFSYEVFVDGTLIDLQTELNTTAFAYNLTANVTTLASNGQHLLTINVSDGHTSREIGDWDYDRNILTKRIRYNFGDSYISVYATDAQLADSFDTIKQKDRYQFVHKRARTSSTETYRITSDKKISIIEGYEEYQGWIVINDLKKWIDFNNDDGAKSKVTRVDEYTVEVSTSGLTSQDIVFNSIGSLNVVTETFSFFKGNLTHNIPTSTFENEIINFEIVFNTNDSLVQDVQANLFWNGTNEGFDIQINGTNQVNFTKVFTVPQIDTDQFVDVFWNYTITGTQNNETNTTDVINQTVFNFNFTTCVESSSNIVLKLVTLNEEDDSVISNVSVEAFFTFFVESGFVSQDNATKINASFVFPLAQNYSICLDPFNETLVTDADIDYDTQGFSQRNFFLRKASLGNNITKVLNLYLINSSIATTVEINVVDNEDQPKADVFVKILRRFIGNNSFKEVEVAKTDDDGSTVARLVLNDEFYKFVIQEDNVTIFTSTERKILSDQIFIRIGDLAEFLDTINKIDNLEFTLTNTTLANGSVDFTFFYNDLENIVREGCLRVRSKGIVDNEICEICSSAASATITCIAPNTTNSILVASAFIDSDTRNSQFIIAVLEIDFLSEFRNFGQIGVYLSLLIMSVMIGVAIWTPTGAMVFGTIATLASYGMGLIGLSYGTIIGLVAMVIYIIASRRN